MTVSAQTPINRSTGNGVTTVFPYTFKIISDGDIEVSVDDVVKTLNVDYTVSGAGLDAGGDVTMTTAPAVGTAVVRRRDMAIVRSTDYQDQGTLPAATLDLDIDSTVLMMQQLDERMGRTFSLPASSAADGTMPAPVGGYVLGWDALGKNLTNLPASAGTSLIDLAASSGSSLVGYTPAGAGAVATTVQEKLRESVSVEDFFIAAEADAAPMLNRAGSSGAKTIRAVGRTYALGSVPVAIQSGQVWNLTGSTFTTASSTATLFYANTVDDWAMIGPFTIDGTLIALGTAKGISIIGCNRYRIENPTIKNMKGWGLYVDGGTPSGTYRGDQGHIVNPQLYACYYGMEFLVGAEYCTVTVPMISGCAVGAIAPAGNVIIQGGNIVDNTDGLKLTGGANHAHGLINGVNINHNVQYNLICDGVTNGETFTGCHFYSNGAGSGAIYFKNSKGIVLDGGHLDCYVYNDDDGTGGYNYISGMYCPGSYGDVMILDTGAGKDKLVVQRCTGAGAYASGISINDPGSVYAHATRAAAATQAIVGHMALIWPTVAGNGNRRLAYNATTGAFTVPTGMAGQYRITAPLYFSGTTLVAANSYSELLINGAVKGVYLLVAYGTTMMTATVSAEMHLSAGDVVAIKTTIDGATKFFGGATWESSLTITRVS